MTEEDEVDTVSLLPPTNYRETTWDPRPWVAMIEVYRGITDRRIPAEDGGPWDTEPDEAIWTETRSGYQCWAKRGYTSAWSGYVCVPRDHQLHSVSYQTIEEWDDDHQLIVHGGLTFSGSWLEEGDWWFGFDCGHAFDIHPGMPTVGIEFEIEDGPYKSVYRDLPYVKDQVMLLALQLRAWKVLHPDD